MTYTLEQYSYLKNLDIANGNIVPGVSYLTIKNNSYVYNKTSGYFCREILVNKISSLISRPCRYFFKVTLYDYNLPNENICNEILNIFGGNYSFDKNNSVVSFHEDKFSKASLSLLLFLLTRRYIFTKNEVIWDSVIEKICKSSNSSSGYTTRALTGFGLKLWLDKRFDIFDRSLDSSCNGIATVTNFFISNNIEGFSEEFINFCKKHHIDINYIEVVNHPFYRTWGDVERDLYKNKSNTPIQEITLEW